QKKEREEREALLLNPPPLHGSAKWAGMNELKPFLRRRESFDDPSSILLGAFAGENDDPSGFVHWDGDGHLLTVAPTRTGKAVTTIIPNLLRYRGSAVVLDPKGELYEKTSAWRAANVGPVWRIAPFDDGRNPATARFPRHGFNPLARVRSQHEARALAELMFPRDPNGQEFFNDDAVGFLTGLILFILQSAPERRRTLGTLRQSTSAPLPQFKKVAARMAKSRVASIREAANNVIGKNPERGLPNLRDTLHSKLALWSDPALIAATDRDDVDFGHLKDRPGTVYITVPFASPSLTPPSSRSCSSPRWTPCMLIRGLRKSRCCLSWMNSCHSARSRNFATRSAPTPPPASAFGFSCKTSPRSNNITQAPHGARFSTHRSSSSSASMIPLLPSWWASIWANRLSLIAPRKAAGMSRPTLTAGLTAQLGSARQAERASSSRAAHCSRRTK
ncbi:MAG TPA: type IV secretory system conjugative DNA transfer family protein, partial [Pirellulales bacterium]|nr:type IV secretory system conjugative DNA transfer family protein [Pirellulales bacterium]